MWRLLPFAVVATLCLPACAGSEASRGPYNNGDAGAETASDTDASDAEADSWIPSDGPTESGADGAPDADASPLDADEPESPPTVLTGVLVGGAGEFPGGIGGVRYRSGGLNGVTSATGGFDYELGEPVVFGVADVDFLPTQGAALVSPWQLADNGGCAQSAELERLLVLLQSLDDDEDPSTGTHIATYPEGSPNRSLGALSDIDVANLIEQLISGRTPVAADVAVHRFISQMDGELWTQLSMDTFDTVSSAIRSQGVVSDGTFWYFSWRLGLDKTDQQYNDVTKNNLAIPPLMALQGSDHIGDIDYWNGKLYVPIEDSNGYDNPNVVLYDTELNAGAQFPVPSSLLTEGVPWVAVDGPRASVYLAEWEPTPSILVFSLADISYQREIPLSTTLGRIQGAKVFEGALYANADDDGKTVYKINLETGTVMELFAFHQNFEAEGLAFLDRPDGSQLHTLNATPSATAMEFRHHQRTREPLRKAVCN